MLLANCSNTTAPMNSTPTGHSCTDTTPSAAVVVAVVVGVVLVVAVVVGVVVRVAVSVVVAVVVGVVISHDANVPSSNAAAAALSSVSCSWHSASEPAASSLLATHCTRAPGSSPLVAAGPRAYSLIAALRALAFEMQNSAAAWAVTPAACTEVGCAVHPGAGAGGS